MAAKQAFEFFGIYRRIRKKPETSNIINDQKMKRTKKRVIACKVVKSVYTPSDKILACKPLKKRVLQANIMSLDMYGCRKLDIGIVIRHQRLQRQRR